jgi:hypothetical protein
MEHPGNGFPQNNAKPSRYGTHSGNFSALTQNTVRLAPQTPQPEINNI